jgi:hypothetical protein
MNRYMRCAFMLWDNMSYAEKSLTMNDFIYVCMFFLHVYIYVYVYV